MNNANTDAVAAVGGASEKKDDVELIILDG